MYVSLKLPVEFVVKIEPRENVNMAHLEEVCAELAQKDPTFRYEVKEDGEIEIISARKDQAHKRAMWLKHRVEPNLLYRRPFYRRREK